jgi:AraC family transcriptional regulator of arabinose operon
MSGQQPYGVYGYRFQESGQQPLFQLFATGYQRIEHPDYDWDGMKRIDGPLYLLQYTISGCGRFRDGDTVRDIPAGTAFLAEIPGNHRYHLPEGSEHWTFYFILFRQRHLESLWREVTSLLGTTPSFSLTSPVVLSLQRLYVEAKANRIQTGYQASSLVYQLMMELLQAASAQRQEKDNWPLPVRQAASYMETAYPHLESLDEIASEVSLSKYHFTRMFTLATGISPMDYVTKLRIEKAVELLRYTSLPVHEIADQIGYASGSYFSKVFRSRVGFTPGEFRLAKGLPSIDRLSFD